VGASTHRILGFMAFIFHAVSLPKRLRKAHVTYMAGGACDVIYYIEDIGYRSARPQGPQGPLASRGALAELFLFVFIHARIIFSCGAPSYQLSA
jgi:hypothetical protein